MKGVLDTGMNVGNLYASQRQYAQAAEQYEQALSKAKTLGDLKAEGDLSSNLGTLRHAQQDYEGAILAYQRSLVWLSKFQIER